MAGESQRQHYWDVARAVLMLLGLPYHVAMLFHPGDWIVPVLHPSTALGWLAAFIHLFRMPAFFVVAGYFAAMLLERRDPMVWLQARAARLGLPLLVSLLTLVPLLNYFGEIAAYGPNHAVIEWTYQAMSSGGYWVRHLWFLIVLLYLNGAAAGLALLFPRLRQWRLGRDAIAARHLPLLLLGTALLVGLWQGAVIEGFWSAGLATNLIQQILRVDDLITAAPYFAMGFVLQRSPRLLEAFGRPSPVIIVMGLAAIAFGLAYEEHGWAPLGRFAGAVAAVFCTQMLIAAARSLFDRPIPIVDRLVSGSFVIYLFHLPILIGLYGVAHLDALPPAAGFATILTLTFLLSWASWLVIERTPALNLMFNGVRPPHSVQSAVPVSSSSTRSSLRKRRRSEASSPAILSQRSRRSAALISAPRSLS